MSHPEHEDAAGRRPGVIPEPSVVPEIPLPPEPVNAPESAPPVPGAGLPGVAAPSLDRPGRAERGLEEQGLEGSEFDEPDLAGSGLERSERGGSGLGGSVAHVPPAVATAGPVVAGATPVPPPAAPVSSAAAPPPPAAAPAPTGHERGSTTVAETAIAKVIGVAVRQVPGVHALGTNAARALGQIRDVVGQSDHAQGISVEVGERQVAVDVTLVADYPWPLQDVARNVRAAVYDAVEGLIGKDVAEVNVTITDIDVPDPDRAAAGRAHAEPKERRIP